MDWLHRILPPALRRSLKTKRNPLHEGEAESRRQAISRLWGERAKQLLSGDSPSSWTDSPLVNERYIHPIISGQSQVNWLEFISREYFPEPVDVALSLGCGGGGLERHGTALNIARKFKAYDVSEGAIALARDLCQEFDSARFDYEVADLNSLKLPPDAFDTVFASQSLHHIEGLEHYLDQVERTLKPGGLFIINEFVGPTQYQWTDEQVHHAQLLLDQLPEKYRIRIRGNGIKKTIDRPTVAQMNEVDPTEAIRSAEIIPLIERRFQIVRHIDFGGTILQLLLDDIVGNFQDNAEDKALLQSFFDYEQDLLNRDVLPSDFTLIVMRNTAPISTAAT